MGSSPGSGEFPRPTWLWVPPAVDTFGPEVAEVAELAGFTPDPPQAEALDAIFAVDKRGRAVSRDVGICAPRQNIKTGLLKQAALGWLYVLELPLIVWSAHERDTSLEAFRDMEQLITGTPDLAREVLAIHRGKGDEAIELRGNRRLKFKARTKDGGRGLTGHRVVLDEAMKLMPDTMAALVPTLRAVPNPQLVFAGSAGTDHEYADTWRTLRNRGRAGGDPRLTWVEFGDPKAWQCESVACRHTLEDVGCGLDDETRWWATNTALTAGRITVENLRSDRKLLPPVKFATETLGWWVDPPPDDDSRSMFPKWRERRAPDSGAGPGRVALAVDVAWDRSVTWIAAAVELPDGRIRGELIAHGRGTGWVEAWLFGPEGRAARHNPVGVAMQAEGAPVSALLPLLRQSQGLAELLPDRPAWRFKSTTEPGLLRGMTGGDLGKACGKLFDLIDTGGIEIVQSAELDAAAKSALARPLGDAWVIDRAGSASAKRDEPVDVAPLVALSEAVWLLASTAAANVDPSSQIW